MAQSLRTNLPQVWQLERVFAGGSASPELEQHIEQMAQRVDEIAARLEEPVTQGTSPTTQISLLRLVEDLQRLAVDMAEAFAFSSCLLAQDVGDAHARIVSGRLRQLGAKLDAALTTMDEKLVALDDELWASLLEHEQVAPVAFSLEERRRRARERMAPDKEALAVELGVDGYHGWGNMYNLLVGRMQVHIEEDGEQRALSVGQAANRLDDPDRAMRRHVFERYEEA